MPSNLTVTATAGGNTDTGIALLVKVLTGASASQPGATAGQISATPSVSVTPQATGSKVYGALLGLHGTYTAVSGTTIDADNTEPVPVLEYVQFATTGTTTASTPVTVGATATANGISVSAAEILASGTIAEDASSPAAAFANAAETATTAAFTPPAGSVLVAMISSNGSAGTTTMQVADNFGLAWTEVIKENGGGHGYSGVWVAAVTATPSNPVGNPSGGPFVLAFTDDFATAYTTPTGTGPNPAVWADHLNLGDKARTNTGEVEWNAHGYYGHSVASSILTLTSTYQGSVAAVQAIDPTCPDPMPNGNHALYTSGVASSHPGFAATYGYWEAYIAQSGASVPTGYWPAFWLFQRGGPAWGPEIDIDEYNPPGHSGNVHNGYKNTAGTFTDVYYAQADAAYHVYGMRLDSSHVTFFYDGAQTAQIAYDGDAYPWIIMFDNSVASPANTGTGYPVTYKIDWVRFWGISGVPAQPVISAISPATGIPAAGSVQVSFGAVPGATSYRVTAMETDLYADTATFSYLSPPPLTAAGSSSPLTVSGLTNGVYYNFTVAAINATGYSIESLPVPSLAPVAHTVTASAALTLGTALFRAAAVIVSSALALGSAVSAVRSGPVPGGTPDRHHRRGSW
jgi:Glycosyl hydrolases family 16